MLTDSMSDSPTDQTEQQASESNVHYMQLYLMLTDSTSERPTDQTEQQASESNVHYIQLDDVCYI